MLAGQVEERIVALLSGVVSVDVSSQAKVVV